jgi:Asp-tRNA(Asn)/Glu-tRNA(Gln) amidotransferase A subunit family amidase
MPDLELAYLSATDALSMFRAGTLSPVELLDALIDRIESVDGTINAVVDRRYDEARVEAKASADRYAGGGEPLPLDGLPVAAKEEHPMAGRSWRQGSHVLADVVADVDHPIIERITNAGGIVHIRTATPEFCCAGFCHTTMWGVTRNPWNPDWSPGGSSGGSGAALAAGYAPLATGSDIGGSIRIPSSLSGVVGFKPPFGRVPAMPPYNLDQFCHDGPMARSVADLALIENVIAGPHWRDTASLRFPPTIPAEAESVAGLRVAVCLRLGDWPLAPEVESNTRRVARSLAAAGAVVEEVELPWTLDKIWLAVQAHFAAIMGAGIAAVEAAHGDLLNDYTRAFATSATSELSFYEGLELEGELWAPLGRLFEQFDALVCPTMATDGYRAGESYVDGPFQVGDGQVRHHLLMAMTVPFNLFSRCPVVAVPSGLATNGVPTGVQVVGRTYDDVTAFRVAAAVEATGVGFHDATWRPPATG